MYSVAVLLNIHYFISRQGITQERDYVSTVVFISIPDMVSQLYGPEAQCGLHPDGYAFRAPDGAGSSIDVVIDGKVVRLTAP
jgi:hypothetical protein